MTLLATTAPLEANTIMEEETSARLEAGRPRPGLAIFVDGPRNEGGVTGYSVVWQ